MPHPVSTFILYLTARVQSSPSICSWVLGICFALSVLVGVIGCWRGKSSPISTRSEFGLAPVQPTGQLRFVSTQQVSTAAEEMRELSSLLLQFSHSVRKSDIRSKLIVLDLLGGRPIQFRDSSRRLRKTHLALLGTLERFANIP